MRGIISDERLVAFRGILRDDDRNITAVERIG